MYFPKGTTKISGIAPFLIQEYVSEQSAEISMINVLSSSHEIDSESTHKDVVGSMVYFREGVSELELLLL